MQAITRKKKFEETIKRGTELGVTEFTPVVSENTVRKPNNPDKQQRRWRKIAMDSARITGRDWLPQIHAITPFATIADNDYDNLYYGEAEGERPEACFDPSGTSGTVVVGPEGGLTGSEIQKLWSSGASAVSLGDVNYRAETASLLLSTLWLNAVAPDRDRHSATDRDREEHPRRNP